MLYLQSKGDKMNKNIKIKYVFMIFVVSFISLIFSKRIIYIDLLYLLTMLVYIIRILMIRKE